MNDSLAKRKKLATIIALLSGGGIVTIAIAFSTLFQRPDNFHEVILLLLLGLAPCTLGLMFASIINGADEGDLSEPMGPKTK